MVKRRSGAASGSSPLPKQTVASPVKSNTVPLPIWHHNRRGIPNHFARSSLFRVGNGNQKRQFFPAKTPIKLSSFKGYVIAYCGEELRQDDLDLWLQICHLSRLPRADAFVEFTGYSMLQSLGWGDGVLSYRRLRAMLRRLKGGVIQITDVKKRTVDLYNLLDESSWDEGDTESAVEKIRVRLHPRIVGLFGSRSYTQLDWAQRLLLPPLGKWLHAFYSTHAVPYPLKVASLSALSGSTNKNLYRYEASLRLALDALVRVGFLDAYHIDAAHLVTVKRRTGTPAPEALPLTPS